MSTTQALLVESEVARMLRLTTARVRKLARSGQLPCVILPGEEFRFDPTEIDRWLRERRNGEGSR